MVRSLSCIWTIDPWGTSLPTKSLPFSIILGYYCYIIKKKKKILLIIFPSLVSNNHVNLVISFWMKFHDTLIFLPPWPWTLLCLISLTRFGLSKSIILSWGDIYIIYIVIMLTKMCWQTTLVTLWCTKENCIYCRVLPQPSYKNIMM